MSPVMPFSNGKATISVSGGTMPLYLSVEQLGKMGAAANLAAGTYTATITDASGFAWVWFSVEITEPTALDINASTGAGATCNGSTDGTASVSAGGGTPPTAIPGATALPPAASATWRQVLYSVTVTDANSCTADDSVVIAAFGSPSCFGCHYQPR